MRKPLWMILAALVFLSSCDRTSTIPPRLLINEVMASNESFADFEFNGLPLDWVEIYNPNAEPLRLQDYTLSDNIERPKKYRFPANLVIEPGGYVVVTLVGGNDLEAVQAASEGQGEFNITLTPLHADFGLNSAVDSVFLFADGQRIDRMGIRNLAVDSSVGRFPDGADSIATSFAPTPGFSNNPHGALQPRFTAGGQPQPSLCNASDEKVRVRFTVLADPDIALPEVRMEFIERPGCDAADQVPRICQALFEAAGESVGLAEVSLVDEIRCQGNSEPGDGDVVQPGCPQESTDGSFGNQEVRVLTYEALLPSADEMAPAETILWNLTLADEFGELQVCRCFSYEGGCVTLVINEYQARNIDTQKFVCETCEDNVSVRTPDWIEIYNYGDEPIDITEFGLVGRNAARENNLGTWMFGRDTDGNPDPGYLLVQPGECRLVLADGDGGDIRRVYRKLVPAADGNLVPDMGTKYFSTRFALNPNRRSGADEFALTAAVGDFHVVIDRAVLDFSAYAAANPGVDLDNDEFFLRDLSAARFPDLDFPDAQTDQERYAPEAMTPGRVTDCPSLPVSLDDLAASSNRLACDKPPRFIDEVAVVPVTGGGQAEGRRCPTAAEPVVVFAYVAVDANTSAARLAEDVASFTVELDFQHEGGDSGVLGEDSGLLLRPAADRPTDTPAGMALWEIEVVIPAQPPGLVTFGLRVIDERQGLNVLFDEDNAPRDNPAIAPVVSFSYLSGGAPPGDSVGVNEILPDNETVELPGFAGFFSDRSPDYIEIHFPQDSEADFYDLSGHYLAVEPGPGTPIGRPRGFALPDGIAPIPRGGFRLLALGQVPQGVPVAELIGFDLPDPCSGTLYLVGPDDLGNCVVDRISWDCSTDIGGEVTNDRAYGKFCGVVGSDSRINPSPGEPNELESLFFGAFHTDANNASDDPNSCVEGVLAVLTSVFFLDEAIVGSQAALGEDAITEITFDVEGATKLGSPIIANLGSNDAPDGYVAISVAQSLLLNVPGISRVDYSVSIVDACGNTISSCDPGQRCFSLGIGSEGLPGVVINEANRKSVLPGSGGVARPWLELYNGSAESIDLGGMFLSAQARAPRDVPLPQGTILAAGEALVVLTDGGPALQGVGVPSHLVVELDWITRKVFCFNPNEPCDQPGSANLIRSVCGIDPDSPEDTPDPVRIYLTDHIDRGSCLVDVFGFEFPNPDCSDGTSMGRFPDGAEEIVELVEPSPGAGAAPVTFIRGDADGDGVVDSKDVQLILELAAGQVDPPPCMDRFDVDDNGQVNTTDGIYLLTFFNSNGPPPPPPFPEEGEDPTPDSLSCTR